MSEIMTGVLSLELPEDVSENGIKQWIVKTEETLSDPSKDIRVLILCAGTPVESQLLSDWCDARPEPVLVVCKGKGCGFGDIHFDNEDEEDPMAAAVKMAGQIAENGEFAVSEIKKSMLFGLSHSDEEAYAFEQKAFARCNGTEDKRVRMGRFLESQ